MDRVAGIRIEREFHHVGRGGRVGGLGSRGSEIDQMSAS